MSRDAPGKALGVRVYCSKHRKYEKQNKNKGNYSCLKEIGMTSSVFQLLSPLLGVGKIHLLMSKSLSSSSIAWIPLWLMRKGRWLARSRRIIFGPLMVKPKPVLSNLKGRSGSWPQIVLPPSSTAARASFR